MALSCLRPPFFNCDAVDPLPHVPVLAQPASFSGLCVLAASLLQTMSVVDAGATAPLGRLLMSPVDRVRDQASWCLGNIAGDGAELRDQLIQEGALESFIIMLGEEQNLVRADGCGCGCARGWPSLPSSFNSSSSSSSFYSLFIFPLSVVLPAGHFAQRVVDAVQLLSLAQPTRARRGDAEGAACARVAPAHTGP